MNIKNNLKYFIIVILFFLIFLPVQYLLDIKIDTLKNDKYQTIAQNYKNLTQQLIDDKSYATLNIAIALSENDSYKQFLLGNKDQNINLQKISLKMRENSNFNRITSYNVCYTKLLRLCGCQLCFSSLWDLSTQL